MKYQSGSLLTAKNGAVQLDVSEAIQDLPSDLREICLQLMGESNPALAITRLPHETRARLRAHFEEHGLSDYLGPE